MAEKVKVLVTGTGGRSVGSGIVHSLVRANSEVANRWQVVAADGDPFAWGLYVAPEHALLPFAKSPDYVPALQKLIVERDIRAILPGSEPEAILLANHAAELSVPVIGNVKELMPLMNDKFTVAKKLEDLGLLSIPTAPLSEWESAEKKFGYPLIIKPTSISGGSRNLALIEDRDQLIDLLNNAPDELGLCIQPYIADGENEFTVGVLSADDGSIIDSIVIHRKLIGLSLLHSVTKGGKVLQTSTGYSQGYIVRDEQISSFCESLATRLGSRGPLNVQLRRAGDKIYVFEIHPRFSGTTPIRASAGFNEPDVMLRHRLLESSSKG